MLSKSRYLKGLKCHKALWLNHHKREESYYPESTLQKFSVGNTAGDLAQQYFPGGELALVDDRPNSKAAQKTKALIESGCKTIYEATFVAHNTLIALDILHQIDGKWHAFEVKSTNSAKDEHIRDAAIQYYVMTNAGIDIEDFSIMHFNRTYVRQGEIDPRGLFYPQSVFHKIQKYLADIPKNIERFMEVYQQEEPLVTIGPHCDKPYVCEFKKYCHGLPENQDILDQDTDVPEPGTDIIYKNKEGLQNFLKAHPYPIYSFDFETINYGIPEFDNSRPYQQIPFQYSLHYQKDAHTAPKHFEFLGNGKDDPREALIQQLIKDVGKEGDIMVYFKSFEKTRLIELARDFPQYKTELNAITNRLVDLAVPYRNHLRTEATQKKWSLKIVLPTYLPDRSYDGLEIQQGMATMDVYRNFSHLSEPEAYEARRAMLDYCKLDTLGVLELYGLLFNLGS